MITLTSVEGQNRFGQLLETVQREPVTITRHGRAAAFIVSSHDMQDLLNARARRGKAIAAFGDWSARAGGLAMPAARELSDDEVNRLVHELR